MVTAETSDLNVQIRQMIEKSDGVWKCKICGKTSPQNGAMREHAETHIKGYTFQCISCPRQFKRKRDLRGHSYKCSKLNQS